MNGLYVYYYKDNVFFFLDKPKIPKRLLMEMKKKK